MKSLVLSLIFLFQANLWATGLFRIQGNFSSASGTLTSVGVGTLFHLNEQFYLITAAHVGGTKNLQLIKDDRQIVNLKIEKQIRDAENDLSISHLDAEQIRSLRLETLFQGSTVDGRLVIAYGGREGSLRNGGFSAHALGNIQAYLVYSPNELSSLVNAVPSGRQSIEGFQGFQDPTRISSCRLPAHLYLSNEVKICLGIVEGVSGSPLILRGSNGYPTRIVGIMKQYDRVHMRSYAADLESIERSLNTILQASTDIDVGSWRFQVQQGSLIRVLSEARVAEFASDSSFSSVRGNSGNAGSRGDGGAGGSRADGGGQNGRNTIAQPAWVSYGLNRVPVSSIDLVTDGGCASPRARTILRFSPDLDARRAATKIKELAGGQIQVCERTQPLNIAKIIYTRALLRRGMLPTQGDIQIQGNPRENSFLAFAGPLPMLMNIPHQPRIEIQAEGANLSLKIRVLPGGVQDELQFQIDTRSFQPVMEVRGRNGVSYLVDFRQLLFDQHEQFSGDLDPLLGTSLGIGRIQLEPKVSAVRLVISEKSGARILYAPVYMIQ